jgi:hypothetical protein
VFLDLTERNEMKKSMSALETSAIVARVAGLGVCARDGEEG